MVKYLITMCFCVVLCFIKAFLAIQIVNNNANHTIALNVDMGKNPYLAKDGLSQELFEAIKANDTNWEPVFDKIIAFGPESANGTIILDVINKSNLLSYGDKQVLLGYESGIKKTCPSHNVSFQIALGVLDNKDYIYLIDYCGYDEKLKKEIYNEFLFESGLTYSFESIVNEFEFFI